MYILHICSVKLMLFHECLRMVELGGLDGSRDISVRSEHSRNTWGSLGVVTDSLGLLLGFHSHYCPADSGALLVF